MAIQEVSRRLRGRFDFFIITSRFKRSLERHESYNGTTIIRAGFGLPFDQYLFLPLWSFYYTARFYRFRPVLFGLDISQGSLVAAVLKLFFPRLPFILNIQYGYGDERIEKGRFGINNLAFRFMLSRADFVAAISTYLLNLARTYGYKGPAEVIHNGVDVTKFKITNDKLQKRRNMIITTSRLVQKNGIDTLIKAVAEIKKIIPNILCNIIGGGPEERSLKLQVESLKLNEHIKFLGSIPNEKILKYLQAADIFVRPSRSEGLGISFIEALASGLPIIGTPVGGIPDIIKDPSTSSGQATGLFVRVDDPKDLAQKIILLLRDNQLSKSIAEEGRKMVEEKFSWDKISAQYDKLFLRGLASLGYEAKPRRFRILIATPLFPPQLGGPAIYAQNLSEEFLKLSHNVRVVSFGKYLRYPSGLRHLLYFFALARRAVMCDLIFALDYISVGFPASIISLIFRKPLVIRVEGDFLWESFVERTREDVTLLNFYLNPPNLTFKEKLVKQISGWTMCRANRLVFSSEWRRQMVLGIYKIPPDKTKIIRNAFPFRKNDIQRQRVNVILWAGRMLYLKNLQRLIRAFADINVPSYELHLAGEGPERKNLEHLVGEFHMEDRIKFFPSMVHEKLMEKLVSSTAVVLPSLSDVGPNIVAEAAGSGVHVIMTKESGYAEEFHGVELIDPLDEDDLRKKLEKFIKEPAERKMPSFAVRPWADAAGEWINLFDTL